jgi:hypothetical protein
MDLLGGYGSDGSDGSSSSSGDDAPPLPPKHQAPPPRTKSIPVPTPKSKRGKKLVSLHAVLPAHILEQLTKGSAEYDDSDDEEAVSTTAKPSNHRTVKHHDSGFSSFLSDLNAAPTTKLIGGKTTLESTKKQETLGSAFLTSETVVVSRSKLSEVVDIHGSNNKHMVVETVHDDDDNDDAQDHKEIPRQQHNSPRVFFPRASVPRPTAALRVAAPPNFFTPLSLTPSTYPQEPIMDEPTPNDPSRLDKKRSRKEMEKALRSGNFSGISGDNVQTLDTTADANTYIAPAQQEAPRHNVKVAPVRMYDTKAGTDVLGASVSSKAKGKNQVNHLMAAAAAFELKESQGMFQVKSHKANAKRKYGW